MKPVVLILCSIYDFSADLVTQNLSESGVPFIRLNRESMKEYRFSLDPTKPQLEISGDLINASIDENVVSVWYRQPVFLRNTSGIPLSIEEQLERSQWSAFLRALSVFDSATWMNWPQATYLAESKPYQLLMARRCGFHIPQTLVGNDINEFQEAFHERAIIKSLDTVLLRNGDKALFTYSTPIDIFRLEPSEIYSAPLTVQEEITVKRDIRVTVIENDVFSVEVLQAGKGIEGDWRTVPREELEYIDCRLPDDIVEKCINLNRNLGLRFSATDLVFDGERYFFLETNPTGEWGWLANEERPLDRVISHWLADPKT